MIKEDALKKVKKLEAFMLANKFAVKNGAEPLEWDGDCVTKLKCQKRGDTTTINLFGPLLFMDDGEEMVEKIQNIQTPKITVNINSEGGELMASRAIANALMSHEAEVTTNNLAIAASAGSIIFMAGDNRISQEGSQLMIHNILGGMIVFGNKETLAEAKNDIDDMIELLAKMDTDLAKTYSKLSNLSVKQVTNYMNKETFFNAEETMENGLATGTQEPRKARNKKSNTIQDVSVEAVSLLKNMFGNDTK